jgi:stearoyl-CoA desaturase (delta-9 desaturase)
MIINVKYAVDLLRKPNHVWFHKHQLTILWAVPLFICLFDWRLAFCGFFLVTGISLLQDNTINVLGHLKGVIGYRNFQTKDNSHNNPILGFVAWGQGWHNNHHYSPANYDFGSGVSGKWWEFDPCRIFLPFLK